jgi:hypothetical protein
VVVFDELSVRMMKPRNPEVGMWKRNMPRRSHQRWKPTSGFLMEKYVTRQQESVFSRLGGYKRERSLGYNRRDNGMKRYHNKDLHWRPRWPRMMTRQFRAEHPIGEHEKGAASRRMSNTTGPVVNIARTQEMNRSARP